MRRRLVGGRRCIGFGFLQALAQAATWRVSASICFHCAVMVWFSCSMVSS
jgi:hypothetical protein